MHNLFKIFSKEKRLSLFLKDVTATKIAGEKWENIFGEMGHHLHLLCIKRGILIIGVQNTAWKAELLFYQKDFLEKINQILKKIFDYRVYRMTVIFSPDGHLKERVIKRQEKKDLERGLKEKIEKHNETKRGKGYVLCSRCLNIYIDGIADTMCIFCSLLMADKGVKI